MKKLILARYGGLSPIKQNHYTSNYDDMSFHGAPEKYGIYAFLWPYIDWFLLSGTNKLKSYEKECKNKREQLNCTYKKFSVNGPIWVHIDIPSKYQHMVMDKRGDWVKIHSEDYVSIFKKVYAITTGQSIHLVTTDFYSKDRVSNIDYTLKSAFKFICTDHLEIFVPKGTKII